MELMECDVNNNRSALTDDISSTWTEEIFSDEMEKDFIQEINQGGKCLVDFSHKSGKVKLALMMTVAAKAHKLLVVDDCQTKRSLYYELKGGPFGKYINEQCQIDCVINNVAKMLQCTTWELGEQYGLGTLQDSPCIRCIFEFQVL